MSTLMLQITIIYIYTGYKLVRQFLLPAETICHFWLPPKLSAISCFLQRLLSAKKDFLLSFSRKLLTMHSSLHRKQEITEVSAEAKYDVGSKNWQTSLYPGVNSQTRTKVLKLTNYLCFNDLTGSKKQCTSTNYNFAKFNPLYTSGLFHWYLLEAIFLISP